MTDIEEYNNLNAVKRFLQDNNANTAQAGWTYDKYVRYTDVATNVVLFEDNSSVVISRKLDGTSLFVSKLANRQDCFSEFQTNFQTFQYNGDKLMITGEGHDGLRGKYCVEIA